MATRINKTTFSLDTQTVETIKRLSALWHISKSEVVRRSIAQSASAQVDRKITIKQLQDYWREHSIIQDYSTQEL
jgi:hypothetical protein